MTDFLVSPKDFFGFSENQITCRLKGTYIGPYNVELYVSNYGKSQTENEIVHVDSLGQPFLFHTLADVNGLSASSGSENGGQFLTMSGTGFDENPGQTKVFIGGIECKLKEITSTKSVTSTYQLVTKNEQRQP